MNPYQAVVIGVSAGGLKALSTLVPYLPADFPLPVLVVQHVLGGSDSFLSEYLNGLSAVRVKEAEDKEQLERGTVYLAPPDYHMLVEEDGTISLSVDPKVNYSRPSIDVLFESAAFALGPGCIGIVLTGANRDGARGLAKIKNYGGLAIVQSPVTAEFPAMPSAALQEVQADYTLPLEQIGQLLQELGRETE